MTIPLRPGSTVPFTRDTVPFTGDSVTGCRRPQVRRGQADPRGTMRTASATT